MNTTIFKILFYILGFLVMLWICLGFYNTITAEEKTYIAPEKEVYILPEEACQP